MAKKTGVEYTQIPIDNTGVVPIDYSRQYNYQLNPRFEFGAGAVPDYGVRQVVGNIVPRIDDRYNNVSGDVSDMSPDAYMQGLATAQSGWNRLGRGFVNMLGTAATTFVSNLLGLPVGIAEAVASGELNRVWNNAVTNYGEELLTQMNETNPIYRRQGYEDLSALQRLGTSEWWADNVQSTGFLLGTIGSALTTGGIMGALGASGKLMGALNVIMSAYGESAIEATNKKNEGESQYNYAETQLQQQYDITNMQLDNQYRIAQIQLEANRDNPSYNYEKAKLDQDYANIKSDVNKETTAALEALNKDRYDYIEAGNLVFATNMILLTLTNAFEFGNLFTRGLDATKKVGNSFIKGTLKEGIEGTSRSEAIATAAGRYLATGVSEGAQEIGQNIFQKWGELYSKKHNGFYDAAYDPEAISYANDLVDSFTSAFSQTMGDQNALSEGMSGFLTGMLFGGANGTGFISSVKKATESQEMADKINSWMEQMPETEKYYRGLVRKLSLEQSKTKALDAGDVKGFKDAESAQFISDMLMFYQAGRTDLMDEILNTSIDDMTDEDINTLIEETSTDGEGVFMSNGNKKSIEEVRTILKDNLKTLQDKATDFKQSLDLYTTTYPNASSETLEQLMFLDMQVKDTTKRRTEIVDELFGVYSDKIVQNLSLNDTKQFQGVDTKQQFADALVKDTAFVKEFKALIEDGSLELDATTANDLTRKIDDVKRLDQSVKDYLQGLKDTISDINKSNATNQSKKEKAAQEKMSQDRKAIKDRLKVATSLSNLREIVSQLYEEDNTSEAINAALDELDSEGNAYAKTRKQILSYQGSVGAELSKIRQEDKPLSDETIKDARSLLSERLSNVESYQEAIDENPLLFNKEILRTDGISEEELNTRYDNAVAALQTAIGNVKKSEAYKRNFAQKVNAQPKSVSPTSTGAVTGTNDIPTTPPINGNGAKPLTPTSQIGQQPGAITASQMAAENDGLNQIGVEPAKDTSIQTDENGKRVYYKPAIPEYATEDIAKQKPVFRPFDVVKTWANKIYSYLTGKNAFSYVNSGELKVGDEIHFMVVPDEEFKIDNYPSTIFIVKKVGEDWQIVGSLNQNGLEKWVGLKELTDKIHKEWEATDKSSPYVTSYYTHVAQVMNGQVPTQEEERTISSIPNIENVKFGVMMNDGIRGNVEPDKIMQPNTQNKEGHVYMLIPGANGMYMPMSCRTRYFNAKEFDITKETVASTPIGKKIIAAIKELAEVSNDTERSNAVAKLSKLLYLGDLHIDLVDREGKEIDSGSDKTPVKIKFRKDVRDSNNNIVKEKEQTWWINLVNNPSQTAELNAQESAIMQALAAQGAAVATGEEAQERPVTGIAAEIQNVLVEANLPMQVDVNSLKTPSYVKELIESDVLTSNVADAAVHNSFFTVNAIDENGNELQAEELKPKASIPDKPTTPNNPSTPLQPGQTLSPVEGEEPNGTINNTTKTAAELTRQDLNDAGITPPELLDGQRAGAIMLLEPTNKETHTRYVSMDALGTDIRKVMCITLGTTKDGKTVDFAVIPVFSKGLGTENKLVGFEAYYVFDNGLVSPITLKTGSTFFLEQVTVTKLIEALGKSKVFVDSLAEKIVTIGSKPTVFTDIISKADAQKQQPAAQEEPISAKDALKLATQVSNDLDVDMVNREVVPGEKIVEWKPEQELSWMKRVLPQLSTSEHLSIIKGVRSIVSKGARAWGNYKNGLITLSEHTAEGTLYHEAFHAVFDLYLTDVEKESILADARKVWGNLSNEELNEKLAEAFRQYTLDRQNRTFGQKIIQFFKDLYNKVMHYNEYSSQIDNLYRNINQGRFADYTETLDVDLTERESSTAWSKQNSETLEMLKLKGWTEESYNSMSEELRQHILRCAAV